MPLAPGARLGPYEVLSPLGAGGMGEVWRARDLQLGREVALKTVPSQFAGDAERLARFEREAKALAALNHPRIAAIYGLEELDGQRVLVMELALGTSLADRLARGPLAVREALAIGRQIAEGIEAAHEKGLLHRDLKPANVQVSDHGEVKILDFGLAKALDVGRSAPGSGDPGLLHRIEDSPTLTAPTQHGVILGTAAYMSPEQARGLAVDTRADIWAFGCVLYECLTGKRAFPGATVTDALAAILEREPDWAALPAATPANVRTLLARCLRKDARDRLRDIGDARLELAGPTASGATVAAPAVGAAPSGASPSRHMRGRWIALVHAALTLGLAAGLIWALIRQPPAPAPPRAVTRLSITLPPNTHLGASPYDLTISPDGREVVVSAGEARGSPGTVGDVFALYRRSLEESSAKEIPGTEYGSTPRVSPDGRWVAYFDSRDQKLKRVSFAGGSPMEVLSSGESALRTFAWAGNDALIFSNDSALLRVPVEGGKPESVLNRSQLSLPESEFYLDAPSVLPAAGSMLFGTLGFDSSKSGIWIRAGDKARRLTAVLGTSPMYVPSGHLLFLKPVMSGASAFGVGEFSDLYAVAFDPAAAAIAGTPTLAIEGVHWGQFAVSETGTLVYNASREGGVSAQLVSVNAEGMAEPLADKWVGFFYSGPRVSPDGTRVLGWGGPRMSEWRVRIFGLRDRVTRILAAVPSGWAAWTPDGQRIVFNHQGPDANPNWNLYWKSADGSGPEERLTTSPYLQQPLFVTQDGWLVYQEEAVGKTGYDLLRLPLNGSRVPVPLRRTRANEFLAALAPDGAYMAFVSDETGRAEVWTCSFAACGSPTQVSQDGGTGPVWSRDGRTLYYRDLTGGRLFAVPVTRSAGTPAFGTPTVTSGRWLEDWPYGRNYDVMPDGKHVAMVTGSISGGRELTVVLNWFEELKAKVAAAR